ncbi:unnamed protein product [Choristocarpus tenellus]
MRLTLPLSVGVSIAHGVGARQSYCTGWVSLSTGSVVGERKISCVPQLLTCRIPQGLGCSSAVASMFRTEQREKLSRISEVMGWRRTELTQTSVGGGQDNDAKDIDKTGNPKPGQWEQGKKASSPVEKLQTYGMAGLLAYGMLNALYYILAFCVVWSGSLGTASLSTSAQSLGMWGRIGLSSKRFVKVITLVWAGSQATKPLRGGGALLLAPWAEKVLDSTEKRLHLPSRKRALAILCSLLLSSTLFIFAGAILSSALALGMVAVPPPSSAGCLRPASSLLLTGPLIEVGLSHVVPRFRPRSLDNCKPWDQQEPSYYSRERLSKMGRRMTTVDPEDEPKGIVQDNVVISEDIAVALLRAVGGSQGASQVLTGREETAVPMEGLGESPSVVQSGVKQEPVKKKKRSSCMSPQKFADINPPPQKNIHGWNEHPTFLLGFWKVGDAIPIVEESNVASANPAGFPLNSDIVQDGQADAMVKGSKQPTAAAIAPQEPTPVESSDTAGVDSHWRGQEIDLGSDLAHHVDYVVLKRDGTIKTGPPELGILPRGWRFTPANRRIVFEVDVPARGIALR